MQNTVPAALNTAVAEKAARGARQRVWLSHLLDAEEGLNPGDFTRGQWGASTYSAIREFILKLESAGYVVENRELGPRGGMRRVITGYVPELAPAMTLLLSRRWIQRFYGRELMLLPAEQARELAAGLTERQVEAIAALAPTWDGTVEDLISTARAMD